MKIFLIRHGESMQNTKLNNELMYPDNQVYLTEKGIKQANEAGKFLKDYIEANDISLNNSCLWVSPYTRTRQTANEINKYLNIENVKEDITLIEQRYGLFSDKTIDDIRKLYVDEFAYYDNFYQNDGRFYAILPQGESPMDVALRTKQFIDTIFRDKEDVLFVVSHGTVIRTFVMNWFHRSPEWFNSEPNMENCSIRLVERDDDGNSKEGYIYKGPRVRK